MNKLPPVVMTSVAEAYKEQMTKPDLVFLTQENQDLMRMELAARQQNCEHDWGTKLDRTGKPLKVCKTCFLDMVENDETAN